MSFISSSQRAARESSSQRFRRRCWSPPADLPGGVTLFPCFPPSTDGMQADDPMFRETTRMAEGGRYIYDGWLPVQNLDARAAIQAVRQISESLAAIVLVGGSPFRWEVKYPITGSGVPCPKFGPDDVAELAELTRAVNELPPSDQAAVMRSIGWLSASNDVSDPAAAFLFAVVAVESLCSHIERAVRKNHDSLLKAVGPMAEDVDADLERRHDEARARLDEHLPADLETAVRQAFGALSSTTNVTRTVLERVFEDSPATCDDYFKGKNAVYNLRHLVAHGSLQTLDPEQVERLTARLRIAQIAGERLVKRLLKLTVGYAPQKDSIQVVQLLPLRNITLGNRSTYQGPTEMAYLYAFG